MVTGIGSFGAGYRLGKNVLVSSADGVGTKVKIAIETQCHNTVGHDLVNHCVNDIGVQGAEPLFFLDYFATGKLIPAVTAQVIQGIAAGCTENHCSLIGGETAEMPGTYQPNDYDLAGFIVGVVSEDLMITGSGIQAGDTLIALPSNGLHTNGYSLARQVLRQHYDWDSHVPELGATLAAELLRIHQSYLPTIFQLIQQLGQVPVGDWCRTFNLGVGMILAVPGNGAYASGVLKQAGVEHWIVGTVQERPSADADQVLWV